MRRPSPRDFLSSSLSPAPNSIVLDSQGDIGTVSAKRDAHLPLLLRVGMLERIQHKLRRHDPDRDGDIGARLDIVAVE